MRRPDFTLSGRAARMSSSGSAAWSRSLNSNQLFRLSPGFGFSRTSIQPPWSFSPASRNFRSPFLRCSPASPIGAQVPVSQTIIGPPPYSPAGITPSKSMYSTGWSSVSTASRFSAGSSDGPFGTAQLFSTPPSSSRRS